MTMAAIHSVTYQGVLTILIITSVSSVYVRRGSNITDCSLTCHNKDGVLEIYRQCGGQKSRLLELWCDPLWHTIYESRFHLNTSSGCWTLTDAKKNDSCVYTVVYNGNAGRPRTTLPIIVLDPVLISNITSNSNQLGQDIAVMVQFSGEETAVTWEVDGGPLPDRYRLIDDNRTLLIPSAQRDDDRRRLSVRITNPVSEETREYQLKITDLRSWAFLAAPLLLPLLLVVLVIFSALIFQCWRKKKMESRDVEKKKMESGDVEKKKMESGDVEKKKMESRDVEKKKMNGHSEDNGRPPRSRSHSGGDTQHLH